MARSTAGTELSSHACIVTDLMGGRGRDVDDDKNIIRETDEHFSLSDVSARAALSPKDRNMKAPKSCRQALVLACVAYISLNCTIQQPFLALLDGRTTWLLLERKRSSILLQSTSKTLKETHSTHRRANRTIMSSSASTPTATTTSGSTSSTSKSSSSFPWHYVDIRPHHLLLGYAVIRYVASTRFYRKLADKLLNYASAFSERLIPLVYYGIVPDFVIRAGIRLQLRDHLAILAETDTEIDLSNKLAIVEELRSMPIAIDTDKANAQHYEVPARFYDLCLGPMKKYSCGYWASSTTSFEESETDMLDLYCQRAQLQDGMKIVDLGCGWGSLTLHLAAKYPNAKITSISNSQSQREYILKTAKERGLNVGNINVITVSVCLLVCEWVLHFSRGTHFVSCR